MTTTNKNPFRNDIVFQAGLLMIPFSIFIFFIPELFPSMPVPETYIGYIGFNYVFTATFFVTLIIHNLSSGKLFRLPSMNHLIVLLILSEISAFSLNRELPIFEESTLWLGIFLMIQAAVWIVYCFRESLPEWALKIIYFLISAGLPIYIYYSIHLMILYPIGLIGSFVLGLSLHVFVPLIFTILTITVLVKTTVKHRINLIPIAAGLVIPLAVCMWFVKTWDSRNKLINTALNDQILNDTQLPQWVEVSKILPSDWISEKILKSNLVYRTINTNSDFFRWNIPQKSFDEIKQHDPLVMVASMVNPAPEISLNDRIKILESRYDARHKAQERLWNGKDLSTSNVITNIRLYPEYRLAYTEKIISIRNNSAGNFNSAQEAIYTFHMPEAAVVTSLSLWINGKEEKGILTTKSKADSAYKTIVGSERRDPSVIHWQEGNTVSVRIFPCTRDDNRRFKIGITAPLKKEKNNLVYRNIYFSGPPAIATTETIQVESSEGMEMPELPFSTTLKNGKLIYNGNYNSYWEATLKAPALKRDAFTFNGKSYYIDELKSHYKSFDPQRIFLDINASWTRAELVKVWEMVKSREVYVADNSLMKVSESNLDQIFESAMANKYSLFPFFLVNDPSVSLIISKNPIQTPNLSDLKGSRFASSLTGYLEKGNINHVFILSDTTSPYIKALKELRLVSTINGDIDDLSNVLNKKHFVKSIESDSTASIDYAGVEIREVNTAMAGNAPDHLLRLFNYNKIMRITGEKYFNPEFNNDEAISLASTAYCVSPLSSLVVLETKIDYERFGIEENKNSLHNASVKSSGAVPEPHEWFLIILTAFVGLFLLYKNNMIKLSFLR